MTRAGTTGIYSAIEEYLVSDPRDPVRAPAADQVFDLHAEAAAVVDAVLLSTDVAIVPPIDVTLEAGITHHPVS